MLPGVKFINEGELHDTNLITKDKNSQFRNIEA